jgi:hypothetical protein
MGRLKALIGLLAVGGAVYMGAMVMPVYFSSYQFKDEVVTESKFASIDPNKSEENIREAVYKKAQSHELPLKPEQIRVTRNGRDVTIEAPYTVTIDLIGGKQWVANFPISATSGKANN